MTENLNDVDSLRSSTFYVFIKCLPKYKLSSKVIPKKTLDDMKLDLNDKKSIHH